ncbi:ATP-binding protein [Granulicella sibirica]|nr:ATP-binding protein [Granulicella sibirica]
MNSSGPIALLLLTASSGGLLIAWLRTRRRIAALKAQLAEAGEKLRLDDLETTRRTQLDTVRNEFISTVSHELRTPLTSIRGALGLLSAGLMGSVDAKANKLLRIAITNTDRLIRLVNDILDLERLESGRAPLQLQRCLLGDLVTQAMETMSPMADAAGVKLVYSPPANSLPAPVAPESEPAEVTPVVLDGNTEGRQRPGTPYLERRREERRGDGERRRGRDSGGPIPLYFDGESDRILQVLLNLLSNSIKFSPPNTTVTIYVEASPDLLQLRVSDEGRGIPQDKLETVFDRFQQVDATDAREKGGTGLGLAICRSIIQQHGGAIWAQRNPTVGASLCVDLPRSNRSTDRIPGKVPQPLSPAPGRDAGAVLVCDDDPGIRTVVTEHLRRRGYTVLETSTGEQALEIASRQKLSAILLDLYMPNGLNGWETLQRLKDSPVTAKIPVVILSVLSSSERPAMENEAQGWVQKPFNENFLFSELGRVLRLG